jgi:hypothetical protein
MLSGVLLARCGPAAAPTETPRAPLPSPSAPAAPDAGADASAADGDAGPAAATAHVLGLQPIAANAVPSAPHVEILFPFAEQQVPIPKAKKYSVRFKLDGKDRVGAEIALDDARPRPVLDKSRFTLGDLVTEGSEIGPGPHWLVLAAVGEGGSVVRGDGGSREPFAAVHFWVGQRDPNTKPEPVIFMLSPSGTYNGPARSRALRVDFVAAPERLGVHDGAVLVKVSGAGQSALTKLSRWQPVAIQDPPDGDLDVELGLLDPAGKPLSSPGAQVRRRITVNRELGAKP